MSMGLKGFLTTFFVSFATAGAVAQDADLGRIHDYPYSAETQPARPNQLSFALPQDGLARAETRSDPFYAIILKSRPRCAFTFSEMDKIQSLFPRNKVFFDRFDCPDDPEDWVYYTGVDTKFSFLAVYGGRTRAEAEALFDDMALSQRFPGANIRKMQAVLAYP